jgi:kynurenine formamidase
MTATALSTRTYPFLLSGELRDGADSVEIRSPYSGDLIGRAALAGPDDVAAALDAAGHALQPRDIVLMHTGRDAFYGQPGYIDRGPGATAEATRWLYERGVRVMGVDAWGWDRPLRMQAAEAIERDAPGVFWEAHQVDLPYCQIERLVNLAALPSTGFTVACFPLRIVRASAGPARVVAILED